MNTDIEKTVKQCSTCFEYQCTQLCETVLNHYIPCKSWVVGADVYMINNNNLLCIVDYYSMFPVVKTLASLSVHDPVQAAKTIFAEVDCSEKLCLISE